MMGEPLAKLKLPTALPPGKHAVQLRVLITSGAAIEKYVEPSGPGVRVDSGIRAGPVVAGYL